MLIGGLGAGLFFIILFVALSVLICLIGLRTDRPGVFCVIATFISLFVILFIVLVPKDSANPTPEPDVVYDHTSGFRKGVTGILVISTLVTGVLLCSQVVLHPIQGSRIRMNVSR